MSKSIIITGASSGIGKATVIKLVESGYQVFGLARRYDKLVAISSKLLLTSSKDKGVNYVPVEFDIIKPERFGSIINDILSKAKGGTI